MSNLKLTYRGEKVVVITAMLAILGVGYFILGLWFNCDLRPNQVTKQCQVVWQSPFSNNGDPFMKGDK